MSIRLRLLDKAHIPKINQKVLGVAQVFSVGVDDSPTNRLGSSVAEHPACGVVPGSIPGPAFSFSSWILLLLLFDIRRRWIDASETPSAQVRRMGPGLKLWTSRTANGSTYFL